MEVGNRKTHLPFVFGGKTLEQQKAERQARVEKETEIVMRSWKKFLRTGKF